MPHATISDREMFMVIEVHSQIDFLCKSYIPSALEDNLYYMTLRKEFWNALEKKYEKKYVCLKTFMVAKFLNYKMSYSKTV